VDADLILLKLIVNKFRKKNILFNTSDPYPPFRVDITILFGEEMVSRGHNIDWLFQSKHPCKKSYKDFWKGGKAWVAKTGHGSGVKGKLEKHLLNIINDSRTFILPSYKKYDFIQVKDKFLAAIFAIISCKIYRLKFFYWLSYPYPEAWIFEGKKKSVKWPTIRLIRGYFSKLMLYKVILVLADHIFVQSNKMKRDISVKGIPKNKMTVVQMGIAKEQIHDIFEETDISNGNKKIVLYLGKFFKIRKLEFLIRMFQKVLEVVPDAKFYFIGDGEDISVDQMLKDEAKKLKIEKNILFTGYVPLNDALKYVRNATVCVSSYYPTFVLNSTSPTKVIEYMAMGKAVVGNDHPEQKTLITESCGGICVPYDENEFAKAVVKLLQNPEMAAEMGQRGKLYILKHRTYPVIADILEQAYEKIL